MNTTGNDNFQPIDNPYIVGNPIREQKMFFGREDDFNYIKKKVTGEKKGGLLVLCGSRRSGKTSILFQIMNGWRKLIIKAVPYAEIYVDGELIAQSSRGERSLEQGRYTIILQHPTYGTVTKVVQAAARKETQPSIDMSAEGVAQQ